MADNADLDEPGALRRGGVMIAVLVGVIALAPVLAGLIGFLIWLAFGGD
jgi:hypothetical protein